MRNAEAQMLQWLARILARWLDESVLQKLAAEIDLNRAAPWPNLAIPGDNIWMGARDKEGRMVSFIQSIYWEFGSGLVIPELGLLWNNRGVSQPGTRGHQCLARRYSTVPYIEPCTGSPQ